MRDFVKMFRWMDPFSDGCCRGNLVSKGEGWKFPSEDGEPGFQCFTCSVCGTLWHRDDETGRFYTHRTSWVNMMVDAIEDRYSNWRGGQRHDYYGDMR